MTNQVAGTGARAGRAQIAVLFLYSRDCPSHERALQMLREVMEEEGIDARVSVQEVETEEEAQRLHFPGSPTILVNGADITGDPDLPVALACRAYRHPDGRISPLPPRESIRRALRAARLTERADAGESSEYR